jgi:ADP-ribosylglycohydrolase
VFIAGQEPEDALGNLIGPGDLAAQGRQVFANLGRALAAAGARPGQVAKITIYVAAQESVVAASGILAVAPSPWEAVCLAASAGGDTDTIGAIVGSIAGALHGMSAWPADTVRRIEQVNSLDLGPTVTGLLRLRARR